MLMHKREEVYGKFNNLNIFYAPSLVEMISLLISKQSLNELILLGFVTDYSLN